MSLRHIWPSYFDVGDVKAKLDGSSVMFKYVGYEDIKPSTSDSAHEDRRRIPSV